MEGAEAKMADARPVDYDRAMPGRAEVIDIHELEQWLVLLDSAAIELIEMQDRFVGRCSPLLRNTETGIATSEQPTPVASTEVTARLSEVVRRLQGQRSYLATKYDNLVV